MAVVAGAGQKRGLALQFVSGGLTLFGILLGQTLLVMDMIRDDIAVDPQYAGLQLSTLELFAGSVAAVPTFLKSNPLSAIFILFGLAVGWAAPAKPKEELFPEATATEASPAPTPAIAAHAPIDAPAAPLSTPSANTYVDAPPRN